MRTFPVVFLVILLVGACSASTASSPKTTVDPRLIEGEPLVDYGVTASEIKIGSSVFLGEESETIAVQAGFKAYVDSINSSGGLAEKKYKLVQLDTTGDALTHIQNIRALSGETDGVAIVALLEDHSMTLISEPELQSSQMLGVTLATEEQWSDSSSNVQNVTASCTSSDLTAAIGKAAVGKDKESGFVKGWTQAKFVDAVFLAAAKKGDITRPALAAMAAAFDQSTLC